ncbi:Ig-like domain-containing protein [Herbidospora sp. NBRC 101105]|uniref:L,D-transpeptidase n=1 Tax=Herbidospora sp. NBRC 101105 TaxID=3032195 RepID=UPI002557083A|nr:Ig-like domain-containing protein [Herbidospora sp. NBRC 101105]
MALLMVTGCATTATAGEDAAQQKKAESVMIFPTNGAANLPPELPIKIYASGAPLGSVAVTAEGGKPVEGVYSADRTMWRSVRPMMPGTHYTVAATAGSARGSSSFSTLAATKTFEIDTLLPNKDYTGLTVGVGMPIMITFNTAVKDRVSIERNLLVQASKPVEGAWHWFDDKTIAYRPKKFWPPRTKVRVTARMAGVRGDNGLYGGKDVVRDFTIGRSQITKGDITKHTMDVIRDGKVIRTIPFSAGKGGVWKYHTTSGIHLAMSREDVTVMTSPDAGPGQAGYYQQTVYDTVRISNSGEYVHGAPWSVGSQGNSNVSHGCVNISPSNAKWYKEQTLIGDPIILTGSPRQLEPTNGWGHWQPKWKDWLKWSRLRDATTDPMV